MAAAVEKSKVKVHYTGTFKDSGEQFDSSEGREPLEFVMGQGMVIAGFEQGVLGKSAGDSVSIEIAPEDGYGVVSDELVFEVRREQIPTDMELEEGAMLEVKTEDGGAAYVRIISFDDELVRLDGNHPLAGKTLLFDITVVEVA